MQTNYVIHKALTTHDMSIGNSMSGTQNQQQIAMFINYKYMLILWNVHYYLLVNKI